MEPFTYGELFLIKRRVQEGLTSDYVARFVDTIEDLLYQLNAVESLHWYDPHYDICVHCFLTARDPETAKWPCATRRALSAIRPQRTEYVPLRVTDSKPEPRPIYIEEDPTQEIPAIKTAGISLFSWNGR